MQKANEATQPCRYLSKLSSLFIAQTMKRKLIIAKATKAAIPSDNSYSLKEIDELIANSELAHQATARFRCYTHLNSTLVQMRML